jgi:hypothetical protein
MKIKNEEIISKQILRKTKKQNKTKQNNNQKYLISLPRFEHGELKLRELEKFYKWIICSIFILY